MPTCPRTKKHYPSSVWNELVFMNNCNESLLSTKLSKGHLFYQGQMEEIKTFSLLMPGSTFPFCILSPPRNRKMLIPPATINASNETQYAN